MSSAPLVVYDLDGTLADTAGDLASSVIRTVERELGFRPARGEVVSAVGWGARNLIQTVIGPAHADRTDAVLAAFRADYRAHLVVETGPYDGIPELLADVATAGGTQAVLTNKPGPLSRELVRRLGLDGHLAAVLGPEDVPAEKPAPGGLLALLERLGTRPDDAVMVGDMETDVDCARAAGVRAVLVTYSEFRRPADLSARADAVAGSVAALRALLLP